MFFQSSLKCPFFMILWWMELHFISTSIIRIMCFLPIMAPNTPCWWLSLNKSVLEPLGLEITENDFVISPEILCAEGAFSLFLTFFTLEENSASTFLAFFLIFCLDNLRLFEVVVVSRRRRRRRRSFVFKPIRLVYWGQFKPLLLSTKLANFFFKIQRCYCWHNCSSYATTNSVNRTQTWI